MAEPAYKLEQGGAPLGCPTCGHETPGWDIIGPDGIAGDTTYMRKGDAEDMAERLNEAYEKGKAAAK